MFSFLLFMYFQFQPFPLVYMASYYHLCSDNKPKNYIRLRVQLFPHELFVSIMLGSAFYWFPTASQSTCKPLRLFSQSFPTCFAIQVAAYWCESSDSFTGTAAIFLAFVTMAAISFSSPLFKINNSILLIESQCHTVGRGSDQNLRTQVRDFALS